MQSSQRSTNVTLGLRAEGYGGKMLGAMGCFWTGPLSLGSMAEATNLLPSNTL